MGEAVWMVETLRDRSGEQPIAVGSCRVARRLGPRQSRRGLSSGSRILGFRKKRVKELGALNHEVTKCEIARRKI
jgi:hypothetical protein